MVQIDQRVILSFFFARLVLENSQKAFGNFEIFKIVQKMFTDYCNLSKKSEEFNHFLIYAFGNMNTLSINN